MLNRSKVLAAGLAAVAAVSAPPAHAVDWAAIAQRAALAVEQAIRDEQARSQMRENNVISRDQLYHAQRIDERDAERDADVARADEGWRLANRRAPGPIQFDPIR